MNTMSILQDSEKYFLLNGKPVFKKYALEVNEENKFKLVSVFDKNDVLFSDVSVVDLEINTVVSEDVSVLLIAFETTFAPNFNSGGATPVLPKTLDLILQAEAGNLNNITVSSKRSNDLAYFGTLTINKSQRTIEILSNMGAFSVDDTFVQSTLIATIGNVSRTISNLKSGSQMNLFLFATDSNFFTEKISCLNVSIVVYPPIEV